MEIVLMAQVWEHRGVVPAGSNTRFRVLGPVAAEIDGEPVGLGSQQLRMLLAALLVKADTNVSTDQLVDILWADQPPTSAVSTLQKLVYRLRMLLRPNGQDVIVTTPTGYELRIDPSSVDAGAFEILCGHATATLAEGDASGAVALFDEALALWHGAAFDEFSDQPFAAAEAARLEEMRIAAIEGRIEAKLDLGRQDEVVGELEAQLSVHRFREHLWELLIVALYRAGRQSDALQAYQRVRALLGDELGIEPGPALRELEGAILRQEPWLGARERPVGHGGGAAADASVTVVPTPVRRRSWLRAVLAFVVVVVIALVLIFQFAPASDNGATLDHPTPPEQFDAPYRATFSETLTGHSGGSEFSGTVDGNVIHDGTYTGLTKTSASSLPICGAGPGAATNTSLVSTASNGDILRETHEGTICQSTPTSFEFSGTYTIQGGTGCFASAQGSGVTSAHIVFDDTSYTSGSDISTDEGKITLKAQPHCPRRS
jgi:DNA-binding SARP family transcriptional activator